jgi:broad specificity phosphatase PhoE
VTLYLVRHGRTAANASGLLLGRADPVLDETGRRQAAALSTVVTLPARVISSPLQRCRETAAAFGRAVEVDERWIELDLGELDGQPPSEVADDLWTRWRTDASFAPPGGESLEALSIRVRAACDALSAAAANSIVVVVTHVSPIKAAIAWALDVPVGIAWRTYVEDASVSRIDVEPAGPVVRWFNRGLVRVD